MSGTSDLTVDPNAFVQNIEYKGENTPDGRTSPKGATGTMQVLPSTATDPGFGVVPAQDSSPDEVARVGRDYAKALLQHYNGNQTLASAAYNAGPGAVDQWTKEFGDPRTGEVSDAQWANQIPYQETKNYVSRVAGIPTASAQTASNAPATKPASLNLGGGPVTPSVQNIQNLAQNYLQQEQGAGSLGQSGSPTQPDPQLALQLIKLMVPPTHTLQPVDYNPYTPGLPGAPKKKDTSNA